MIRDLDIDRAAELLVEQHGEDAERLVCETPTDGGSGGEQGAGQA
jgi:hypothetical protein